MLTSTQSQQLSQLLNIVNELTADSISQWHQTLAAEIRTAVVQIEQLTVAANQAALVQQMAQVFSQQEQEILKTLELPLKALQNLVESGHLTEIQKARLLIQLGKTHSLLTQWDIALDEFYRALDYCQVEDSRNGEDLSQKAEILKSIGHIESKKRDYYASKAHYRESLALYSQLKSPHHVAHIYICLGWNDFQTDNYSEAEANYQKSLEITADLAGAERLIGDAHMNLAILATVRGNFQTAISDYEKSIHYYEALGDERGVAQACYNMGMLYVDMKAWQQAGKAYQKSLEHAQKHSDLYLIGHIHLSRTELALQLMDVALAQASCMQAVKVLGRLGSQSQLAEAYKYAGQIQHRRRAFGKAEPLFQKSIQLAQACQSRLNQAEAHYEYGLMLLDKPDQNLAKTQLNDALDLFTTLGAEIDIQKAQTALARLEGVETENSSGRRFKPINRS